jgi:hypothetical protein
MVGVRVRVRVRNTCTKGPPLRLTGSMIVCLQVVRHEVKRQRWVRKEAPERYVDRGHPRVIAAKVGKQVVTREVR